MAGRPSKYDPAFCELLVEHMEKGYSFESFGGVAKVAKQTLFTWAKAHEDFADAKALGEALSHYWWERTGIEGLFMGGKDNPFNSTVWIFAMKNRFGWRDKPKEDDDEGKGKGQSQGIPVSPADLLELVKQARGGK